MYESQMRHIYLRGSIAHMTTDAVYPPSSTQIVSAKHVQHESHFLYRPPVRIMSINLTHPTRIAGGEYAHMIHTL